MDRPNKDLGQRIRDLREERGISALTLGKEIGVSAPFLYDIEKGKSRPRLATLTKIADFFGVSIDFLLKGEDNEVQQQRGSATTISWAHQSLPLSTIPVISRMLLLHPDHNNPQWPSMASLMKGALDFVVWPQDRLRAANRTSNNRYELPEAYAIYASKFETLKSLNIHDSDKVIVIPRDAIENGALMLVCYSGVPMLRYVYDQGENGILLRDDEFDMLATPELQKKYGFKVLGLVVGCVCFSFPPRPIEQ